jgi:hypothetical protein
MILSVTSPRSAFNSLAVLAVVFTWGCVTRLAPPLQVTTQELRCGASFEIVVRPACMDTRIARGVVLVGERPFSGVSITLRPLGGGTAVATTTTDAEGRFAVARLADGWYQLETCHEALASTVIPLYVRQGSRHDNVRVVVHLAL